MRHSGHYVDTCSQSSASQPKGARLELAGGDRVIVRILIPGPDRLTGFLPLSCSFFVSYTLPQPLLNSCIPSGRREDETVMMKVKYGPSVTLVWG